jgi:hypothetical protein
MAPPYGMLRRTTALKAQGYPFRFEHMFAAELVAHKQAFIERNFHPPILFRDVTEIHVGKEAYVDGGLP